MIGLLLILFAFVVTAAATRSLTVEVSAPKNVTNVDSFNVLTTITNTGDEILRLINNPATPLFSLAAPLASLVTNPFIVMDSNGGQPNFTIEARHLPRDIACGSDKRFLFTLLAPGEVVDVLHQVGDHYNLTTSGPVSYTIFPENVFHILEDDGSISILTAETTPATVWITGRRSCFRRRASGFPSLPRALPNKLNEKREDFHGCSDDQQRIVVSAIDKAWDACQAAIDILEQNPNGSDLELEWFGPFTEENHQQVLVTCQRLCNNIGEWTYDCSSCTDNTLLGFVDQDRYGVMYLCPEFWGDIGDPDDDSQFEVIIHEGTHFDEILGSEDYYYGYANCLALAQENPTQAIDNADNYAYFCAEALMFE